MADLSFVCLFEGESDDVEALGALEAAAAVQVNAHSKHQEHHNHSRTCNQRYQSDRFAPDNDRFVLWVHQEGSLHRRAW